ncbi:ABC-F family ATP-binding cassette domain-containing protein, partial [Enterococcus faecalis]|nr:ABC-F family ATP-binding cassette domain-containing protein [Enterococcus faecalis]
RTTPEVDIRNRLGAFLFSGDDVKKSIAMLSGGERTRALLAKLSMQNKNFLILDEPTNHLDIDSKEVLENALIDFDGTLLFVSHDRYFINRVATKVLELSESGSTLYLGDYDYYVTKKAEQEANLATEAATVSGQDLSDQSAPASQSYQVSKDAQREQRKLTRRIEQIETELESLEESISQLTEQMGETNDAGTLIDLQKDIDQLTQQTENLMEEWEDLSQQLED